MKILQSPRIKGSIPTTFIIVKGPIEDQEDTVYQVTRFDKLEFRDDDTFRFALKSDATGYTVVDLPSVDLVMNMFTRYKNNELVSSLRSYQIEPHQKDWDQDTVETVKEILNENKKYDN